MSDYKVDIADYSELLRKWNKRLRESQFSHYQAERYYKRCHFLLGVPAIIISVFVGSSIIVDNYSDGDQFFRLIVGVGSFLSSALVSLQTFLRFSDLAEKHLTAAARYGALRRSVEQLLVQNLLNIDTVSKEVEIIKMQVNDLALSSPNISKKIWSKSKSVLEEESMR